MGYPWSYFLCILLFMTINAQNVHGQNLGTCITPNQQQGQCIPLMQCSALFQTILKPDLKDEEKQFLRNSACGYKNREVLVCCALPKTHESNNNGADVLPQPPICGRVNQDKIIRGNTSALDEYPWMALLSYEKPDHKTDFYCSGVLINSRYVLTTAQCVNNPKNFTITSVRLGEWNISSALDCESIDYNDCSSDPIDVPIEKTIVHKNYIPESPNQSNDIALLRLSKSISYTDFISPICLQSASSSELEAIENEKLERIRWGESGTNSAGGVKLRTVVHPIPFDSCKQSYLTRAISLEKATHLCASEDKKLRASCQLDAGCPLMKFNPHRERGPYYTLVGLTSLGQKNCNNLLGWPTAHTRIANYVEWIKANIRP